MGMPVLIAHAHSIKRMTLGMSTLETKLSTSFKISFIQFRNKLHKLVIFSIKLALGLTMTDE